MSKKLAVVGGGSSGIVAAIEAKTELPQATVTIFEKMPKACKKILVTGNGRCNFTNESLSPKHFYGDSTFLKAVLTSVYADSENYFRSLGVLSYHEDGRIYPRSQQSSSIREALVKKAESLGVIIRTETPVSTLSKKEKGFSVNGEFFDAVIVAGGGKASAVHGSDGSCYELLKNFRHTITPLYPALCGLVTEGNNLNILKGVRVEAKASLYSNQKLLGDESGEVQFTDKAVSGIPVMNLSHLCKDNKNLSLVLDLCKEISEAELREHFAEAIRLNPENELENTLSGIVNTKLGYAVINKAKIKKNTFLKNLTAQDINNIVAILKCFKMAIKGTKSFDSAQITCGGACANEIDSQTMMSKLCNGLFLCGEIIDIHGDCGGYNLHLAWTTGRIAGNGAVSYLKDNL